MDFVVLELLMIPRDRDCHVMRICAAVRAFSKIHLQRLQFTLARLVLILGTKLRQWQVMSNIKLS